MFISSFCLPSGKAEDTPSPLLSRARSRRLRLHPWCLVSGASSTFAQLRLNFNINNTKFIKIVQIYKTDSTFFQVTKSLLSKSDIAGFIISVDEVERRTGLDFNNLLDDGVEDDMEDDVKRMWWWKSFILQNLELNIKDMVLFHLILNVVDAIYRPWKNFYLNLYMKEL